MLQTERLIFKEVQLSDAENIHQLNLLEPVNRYNTLVPPVTFADTEQMVSGWVNTSMAHPGSTFVFTISIKEPVKFIGLFGITRGKPKYRSAEFWFKFHPDFWNRGFATESIKCALHFCFIDLQLHRVEAGCAVENIASARALEKSGFVLEGRTRKKLPIGGEWHDNFEYSVLEEEYFRIQSNLQNHAE